MEHKRPILAAIIMVSVVAAGYLSIQTAPAVESGEWASVDYSGGVYGIVTDGEVGIRAIHFFAHGVLVDNTDNILEKYPTAQDNDRIGSITTSGGSLTTFPYDTSFDIIVEVQGHNDNMGQVTEQYLSVDFAFYLDTGTSYLTENSIDDNEYTIFSDAEKINSNVLWDNAKNGFTLSADDNMHLENISLWLRG